MKGVGACGVTYVQVTAMCSCRVKDFVLEQDKTVQILAETERLSPKNLLNFIAKFC
jgi:hypothetical protein